MLKSLSKTRHRQRVVVAGLMFTLLCLSGSGCVRRRMTIRSQPPGAQVFIDDQEIGVTPVSTSFTYYGTRKVQLVKDGFETLTVRQNFNPPWYEVPPLDLFSENVYTGELRDERVLDFQLIPQRIVPVQELLDRAGTLRSNARQGTAIPFGTPEFSAPVPPPAMPTFNLPPATGSTGFAPMSLESASRAWATNR